MLGAEPVLGALAWVEELLAGAVLGALERVEELLDGNGADEETWLAEVVALAVDKMGVVDLPVESIDVVILPVDETGVVDLTLGSVDVVSLPVDEIGVVDLAVDEMAELVFATVVDLTEDDEAGQLSLQTKVTR